MKVSSLTDLTSITFGNWLGYACIEYLRDEAGNVSRLRPGTFGSPLLLNGVDYWEHGGTTFSAESFNRCMAAVERAK